MPATTIERILERAKKQGILAKKTEESIDWFRKNIRKNFSGLEPRKVIRENKDNLVNSWTNTMIGRPYMVYYDPKWKKILPYYDLFPLMIPIHRYDNGLLGLNLHYLPPILRAKLLGALYDVASNHRLDENKKFNISYGILQSASQFKEFKPCLKRYLGNHFRSRFVKIPTDQWQIATFLPVENFQKADKQAVWADSRRIIRGS